MSTFETIFNHKPSQEARPHYVGTNKNGDDAILYINEMGNEKHEAAQRKYGKALERSRHNKKRQTEIICKIIAKSIFEGWSGFLDDDGNEVEATIENKIKYLTTMPQLLLDVMEFASDKSNFVDDENDMSEIEAAEDTEKN